ncbi:hypothetical protein SNE40_018796 [Patella caerulea]|uniref:Uncharacterized protein n=3 Tax=Patella caerulea TaxID=87958 RepID=A0AAN8J8A3_PATCE
MMMATPPKAVHDPLYNFETHFPEKLSRLHFNHELSGSFKRSKRKQRTAGRYKTQPITFDEIQEVDEPPPAAEEPKTRAENLKSANQPFSRSIDGLLPKVLGPRPEAGVAKEAPSCVMKRMSPLRLPGANFKAKSPIPELEERLKGEESVSPTTDKSPEIKSDKSPTSLNPDNEGNTQKPPIPSPNMAPRRQKVTAKAKKRQKADGKEGEDT